MPLSHLNSTTRQFLDLIRQKAGENLDLQVSMYEIGEALGLDRQQSAATAEDLMAEGIVEIRTLAGGIGFSPEGQSLFQEQAEAETTTDRRLGQSSPLDERQRDLVEETAQRRNLADASHGTCHAVGCVCAGCAVERHPLEQSAHG